MKSPFLYKYNSLFEDPLYEEFYAITDDLYDNFTIIFNALEDSDIEIFEKILHVLLIAESKEDYMRFYQKRIENYVPKLKPEVLEKIKKAANDVIDIKFMRHPLYVVPCEKEDALFIKKECIRIVNESINYTLALEITPFVKKSWSNRIEKSTKTEQSIC